MDLFSLLYVLIQARAIQGRRWNQVVSPARAIGV